MWCSLLVVLTNQLVAQTRSGATSRSEWLMRANDDELHASIGETYRGNILWFDAPKSVGEPALPRRPCRQAAPWSWNFLIELADDLGGCVLGRTHVPKRSPVQTRPWLEGQAAALSALLRDGICIRQPMYRAELRERLEQAEHDVWSVPRPDHFCGNFPKVICYFYIMFWFVGAAAAAIALPLWFVSELGALLR
jgi:hypothetical protein